MHRRRPGHRTGNRNAALTRPDTAAPEKEISQCLSQKFTSIRVCMHNLGSRKSRMRCKARCSRFLRSLPKISSKSSEVAFSSYPLVSWSHLFGRVHPFGSDVPGRAIKRNPIGAPERTESTGRCPSRHFEGRPGDHALRDSRGKRLLRAGFGAARVRLCRRLVR